MKDPEKDPYVIISSFNWREVFKPSFIGRLQSRLAVIFKDRDKNKYNNMKFKLLLVPENMELQADTTVPTDSPIDLINRYLESHKLSQEDIERLKEIPPHDLEQMLTDWWDRCVVQMSELRKEVENI